MKVERFKSSGIDEVFHFSFKQYISLLWREAKWDFRHNGLKNTIIFTFRLLNINEYGTYIAQMITRHEITRKRASL